MDGANPPVRFLGDLQDPWVVALLRSLRTVVDVHAVSCRDDLPERPFDEDFSPRVIVVHRSRLDAADVVRLEGWRAGSRGGAVPKLILCYGPFGRAAELERCARSVDLLIPEATAGETLPGQLCRLLGHAPSSSERLVDGTHTIEIVSTEHSLRAMLAEACRAAGYRVGEQIWPGTSESLVSSSSAGSETRSIIIWDAQVLEAAWTAQLRRFSRRGPVLALLGFADRDMADLARRNGASACLDVPFDLHDLLSLLTRLAQSVDDRAELRSEPGHAVPPPPAARMGRGRAAPREGEPRVVESPGGPGTPRMPS